MSHPPIEYYSSYDTVRSEAESPATLQDSRIGGSYSVARIDSLPQSNDYLTQSSNALAAPDENDHHIMQNARMLSVEVVDHKPSLNPAIVAMLQTNGDISIDNSHLTGLIDNQPAAAAAAAAVAAATSSVQPQMQPTTLQSLAKPMALRNNQPPTCSEPLLQPPRSYAQQAVANAPPPLQAPPMSIMPPIHAPGTSASPPQQSTLQMVNQIPQTAGIDNAGVHGVIEDNVSMSGSTDSGNNQAVANNGGMLISPVNMPTSVIKVLSGSSQQRPRSEKKPIPEDMKDDKYFERRKRNNMAAKKSRDARKQREDEIAIRASFLEKENAILRAQVATLRDEANSLRQLLLAKRTTTRN